MDNDDYDIFSFIDLMSALSLAFLIIIVVLSITMYNYKTKFDKLENNKPSSREIKNIPKRIIIPNELNNKVFFDKGKYNIKNEFVPILKNYIDTLRHYLSNDNYNSVQIAGHTDIDNILNSSIKDNWDLGALRATEIVRYFINHGISPEYFSASSFSKYKPIDPGKNEDSKKLNRRIEIILQKITN